MDKALKKAKEIREEQQINERLLQERMKLFEQTTSWMMANDANARSRLYFNCVCKKVDDAEIGTELGDAIISQAHCYGGKLPPITHAYIPGERLPWDIHKSIAECRKEFTPPLENVRQSMKLSSRLLFGYILIMETSGDVKLEKISQ